MTEYPWRTYRQRWKRLNPEAVRASKRKWYAKHAEERRAYSRAYYWDNWDRQRQSNRDWIKSHPAEMRAHDRNTRAKRAKAVGTFTADEWNLMVLENNGRCSYCGGQSAKLVPDHVIPLAKNGVNTIDNIVPACQPCNARKQKRDLVIFLLSF